MRSDRRIVDGEALALYRRRRSRRPPARQLRSLNDAGTRDRAPRPPRQRATSAHTASSDLSTVAYIGDLDSASTAISLPLNNENDILQISPGTATSASPTPARPTSRRPDDCYPNGPRTFARLIPSDTVEAARDRVLHALAGRPAART